MFDQSDRTIKYTMWRICLFSVFLSWKEIWRISCFIVFYGICNIPNACLSNFRKWNLFMKRNLCPYLSDREVWLEWSDITGTRWEEEVQVGEQYRVMHECSSRSQRKMHRNNLGVLKWSPFSLDNINIHYNEMIISFQDLLKGLQAFLKNKGLNILRNQIFSHIYFWKNIVLY